MTSDPNPILVIENGTSIEGAGAPPGPNGRIATC
jgi:hypothetical protein